MVEWGSINARSVIREVGGGRLKKRDLKLSDHNVTTKKYNELRYFCLQYGDKRRELERIHGAGGKEIPRVRKIKEEIELIEQTALEADPELYKWTLKSVTEGIPYENMDVPAGRRQFYETRRYFFFLLAQKR